MSEKGEFHERQVVELRASSPRSRIDLHHFLLGIGFTSEDDYYYLDRREPVPQWQSRSLVSVDVLRAGEPVDETEDDVHDGETTDWDSLSVGYLLATLPPRCIDEAVASIDAVATHYGLEILHQGAREDASGLRRKWMALADWLRENHAEPGSEDLRILIEMSYSAR